MVFLFWRCRRNFSKRKHEAGIQEEALDAKTIILDLKHSHVARHCKLLLVLKSEQVIKQEIIKWRVY